MPEHLQPDRGHFQPSLDNWDEVINIEEVLTKAVRREQYLNGPTELNDRWRFYELARRQVDFDSLTIKKLALKPDESVLDAGCGTARPFYLLRSQWKHRGKLVGLDFNPRMFWPTNENLCKEGLKPVDFIAADLTDMPFALDSFDHSIANFSIYHATDPGYALRELQRITKPGGKVIISTSGDRNKLRHRQFEKIIADKLKLEEPPLFVAPFDADNAKISLPLYFKIAEHKIQRTEAIITSENIDIYAGSLKSMRKSFFPTLSREDWQRAFDEYVRPVIQQEIIVRGFFRDYIERHLFVCINDQSDISTTSKVFNAGPE